MAWFPSRVLRYLGLQGLSSPETGEQFSSPVSLGAEATDISDERALQLSAVWSCVRLIAESVAGLPLGFFERTDGGRQPLSIEHNLVNLLKRRPNSVMTSHEFREAMTCQLVLWGNAYAKISWIGRGGSERPTSLTPLRPGHMIPYREADGTVTYHYTTDSGVEVYSQKSIFHLKGFSAEGVVGFSPLALARQSMGLAVAAEQYSASTFRNGGRPVGTLNFDEFLTTEQRTKAREMYENITAGATNNTKFWVLEGGVKYNPIAIPPDDMQMLESRRFQLAEIARFFRVPSHLINDSDKATSWGSGIEQLNLAFLQYTLAPYLARWEHTINRSLLSPVEKRRIIVEHNVEGLLRADSAGRSAFYSQMVQNGLMSRNEVRAKENMAPVDGGDDLTAQVNLVPLAMLGQKPESDPAKETREFIEMAKGLF